MEKQDPRLVLEPKNLSMVAVLAGHQHRSVPQRQAVEGQDRLGAAVPALLRRRLHCRGLPRPVGRAPIGSGARGRFLRRPRRLRRPPPFLISRWGTLFFLFFSAMAAV